MKLLSTILLLLVFSTSATAQTAMDAQIELARQAANMDRKAIILDNMQFTVEEADSFWPAWNEYRAAVLANGDRMLNLVKDFAANHAQMTDIMADEIMTDHFSIMMQNLVIRQQFAQKINMFMPARKVMRVVQIENKLDAAIQMELAAEIPLVK